MKSNILIFFLALLISSVSAQNDAIDRFFSMYLDHKDFTSVVISPKMFDMMASDLDENDKNEFKEVIKDIKSLKILTAKDNDHKYFQDFIKKLPKNEYELLLEVREKDQNIKFYTRESGNQVAELILMIGGEEFVMMCFGGNLDLNKITKLAESMDINGAEHLLKIKDKRK